MVSSKQRRWTPIRPGRTPGGPAAGQRIEKAQWWNVGFGYLKSGDRSQFDHPQPRHRTADSTTA